MNAETTKISVRGRLVTVPSATIAGYEVVVAGRWPRVAMLRDEEWLANAQPVDPLQLAAEISKSSLRADIFSFAAPLDSPLMPGVAHKMDNVAVIETGDFQAWWNSLPQEARKNTRRAAKRGVELRSVRLDNELAAGIKAIYDETPIRQGRRFWHYGKDIVAIMRENGTYLDRCEFLGAFHESQLIGFMKWVYINDAARIMQILCLNSHQDKRPIIALITKAAEICHQRGMHYLIYGKYTYGGKAESSITEFKRRLGFTQKDFPRYHVPLTTGGRIAIQLELHVDWKSRLPPAALDAMLRVRASWLKRRATEASVAAPREG